MMADSQFYEDELPDVQQKSLIIINFDIINLLSVIQDVIKQTEHDVDYDDTSQFVVRNLGFRTTPYSQQVKKLKQIRYSANIYKIFANTFKGCYFINLKQLVLNILHIQSIEFLQFLDAPSFSQLNISANRIFSLKAMQKCNLKKLKYFNYLSNPLVQVDLNRTQLPKDTVYFNTDMQGRTIANDLSQLVKIQPQLIAQLDASEDNRIMQKKVLLTLFERFKVWSKEKDRFQGIYICLP